MSKPSVTAVANLKGGVGKTLVVGALGHAVASRGERVLLIDVDPQGNLTEHITGYTKDDPPPASLADVLDRKDPVPIDQAVLTTKRDGTPLREGLLVIGSGFDELQAVQDTLVGGSGADFRLSRAINSLSDHSLAHVILDCRPATDLVTRNAFVAADALIVVLTPQPAAITGWNKTLDAVDDLREFVGKELPVTGLIINQTDARRADHEKYLSTIRTRANEEGIEILTEVPLSADLSRVEAIGIGIDEVRGASPRLRNVAAEFSSIAETLIGKVPA